MQTLPEPKYSFVFNLIFLFKVDASQFYKLNWEQLVFSNILSYL